MAVKYSDIRGDLKTGDIVLFSGKGGISTGIKWATLSKWSHVGMVLKLDDYDFVTLWESTTLTSIEDLESGEARKGVQLVPLSARYNGYNGGIAIRHLVGVDKGSIDVGGLMEFRKEIKGRKYEGDKIELFKSAFDGPFGGNAEDLSSLFCSEMVAEAYQRMNLLSENKPSNEYTPADFSEKEGLKLLHGSLSKEIIIKEEKK